MTSESRTIAGPHSDAEKGVRRAGWDKLWQVADNYNWSGGQVLPTEGAKIGVYSPLAYREIVSDLAKVADGREKLEDWVAAYGMLEWGSERDWPESNSDIGPESRVELLAFAEHVRECVQAIIEFHGNPTQSNARRVSGLIQPGLVGIHPILILGGSDDSGWRTDFAWRLPTLKDVIMLHLADFANEENAQVRICDECGSFFTVTHGKQRFCPPMKGATWSDRQNTRESRCALRSRKRRHRAIGKSK